MQSLHNPFMRNFDRGPSVFSVIATCHGPKRRFQAALTASVVVTKLSCAKDPESRFRDKEFQIAVSPCQAPVVGGASSQSQSGLAHQVLLQPCAQMVQLACIIRSAHRQLLLLCISARDQRRRIDSMAFPVGLKEVCQNIPRKTRIRFDDLTVWRRPSFAPQVGSNLQPRPVVPWRLGRKDCRGLKWKTNMVSEKGLTKEESSP